MGGVSDILVLPFFGQGHLNPSVELCKRLTSCIESKVILIIPSHLSSSIPSSLHKDHPSIEVLQIDLSGSPSHAEHTGDGPDFNSGNRKMEEGIKSFLAEKYAQTRPMCAVMDLMMSWSKKIFLKENIPIASFFTCGAASTAMEYAAWKAHAQDMKPGETRELTGLPDCVALRYPEIKRRNLDGPPPRDRKAGEHGPDFGLRSPGQTPRWLDDGVDSTALLMNTCHELEGPFLDYISHQAKKPVFGIGPLLPDTYWKSIGKVVHDRDSRSNRKSNYTEDEISQWLDSKPGKSVIYIAFGSEVGPEVKEYEQLADALGDSKWSFIWVIQPGTGKKSPAKESGEKQNSDEKNEGFYPEGLEEKAGKRGIVIRGWAPQLMILSHPSTGGFLSHCGWNSTAEAIGRGVPILAWPIRGDQYYNAKLVVDYLKTGLMVATGDTLVKMVKKSDIVEGIDNLMNDKGIQERAVAIEGRFESGFPSSSTDSIKALIKTVSNN